MRIRKSYYAAAAVVSIALAVSLASALGSSGAHQVGAPPTATSSPRLGATADTAFAAFALPPGSAEDLRIVHEMVDGDRRLDLDPNSVRMTEETDGIEVRIAGDSESVCLIMRVPGQSITGGCGPVANASSPATPMIGSMPDSATGAENGHIIADALFPDGTKDVTVTEPDGSQDHPPVINNTVAFRASADATLGWTGPEGRSYSKGLPH